MVNCGCYSSATLRMDAHLSGEILPPAPVPPAGYIQEVPLRPGYEAHSILFVDVLDES